MELAPLIADLTTILLKLILATGALVCVVLASAWLDRRLGIKFSDAAAVMRKSPAATADYYRTRLLALAIVVAACFF